MKKGLYYILYTLLWLFSLLPLWVHYVIADIICVLVYHVVGYRKALVRKNLADSFPDKTAEELRAIEKAFYHWFCDYLVETVKLLSISRKNLQRRMVFKGTELVNEIVESGQSCACYLGHYCNWEWITSLPLWVSPKVQCGQIYHVLENEVFDQLFLRLRQRFGAVCIPMAETLRRLAVYRQQQKPVIIGYISDQVPFWNNIHHWLDFLHHDTARDAIIPHMLETMQQQNKTYAVIDGFPIPQQYVRVITLDFQPWEIVLASDGYPFLLPTLADSEQRLERQRLEDPLNIGTFKATKAFLPGNNSFDDRSYIRFRV